jgi:hypothetical protein
MWWPHEHGVYGEREERESEKERESVDLALAFKQPT